MRKILLTSDGISNRKIRDEFLHMVSKDTSDVKVLLVTTAGKNSKDHVKYTNKSIKELVDAGILKKNITALDVDGKNNCSIEKRFDILYVCGGNTFFLLKKVRESRFDRAIKNFLRRGKLYVGVSAGSYIACPSIEMATWKHASTNFVGLKNLTALNIVPFMITVHYEKKCQDLIRKGRSDSPYHLRVLKDGQALSVINDKFKMIGMGKEVKVI